MGGGGRGCAVPCGGGDGGGGGVSELSVDNLSKAYELLKRILTDIRGQAYKNKFEKLKKYKKLYDSIGLIHEDYIRIFTRLLDSIKFSTSDAEIQDAFSLFLNERSTLAGDRTLTKMYALTYSKLADDFAEKRFLIAVVLYFYYHMDSHRYASDLDHLDMKIWEVDISTGDASWNSASTLVWALHSTASERDELSELVGKIILAVGERFSMIEKTFSEIDGNWRASKKITKSKFSDFLFTPQGKINPSPKSIENSGEK
jgi:hypothetical protein